MAYEQLKLSNQLCFPIYAASRLITREYQPYLDKLGITYPQYIALLVLWENNGITVNDITQKLILNTNTVTPLLKRMEALGLITRERSKNDERKVIVKLTEKGEKLQEQAAEIPHKLAQGLVETSISLEEIMGLKNNLNLIIEYLKNKDHNYNDE
ncbi:MAG: MarR family winged helix-turn-helix transcriptional regulator [Bacteroidales bacterium]